MAKQICCGFKVHHVITCESKVQVVVFQGSWWVFVRPRFDPGHVTCSPPIGKRIWVGRSTKEYLFFSACDVEFHKTTTLVKHNRHTPVARGFECVAVPPHLSPCSLTAQQHYGREDKMHVGLLTPDERDKQQEHPKTLSFRVLSLPLRSPLTIYAELQLLSVCFTGYSITFFEGGWVIFCGMKFFLTFRLCMIFFGGQCNSFCKSSNRWPA